MNKYNLKNKFIIFFIFIFLILNLSPITIVKCNKEQNICNCVQIFNLLGNKKRYYLKQVKLNDIKQGLYYKEKSSKNYSFFNNIYPGHGVGIELKQRQRTYFYNNEKGDYVISFYDFSSKPETEKFVNKFNMYLKNKTQNSFFDIHISFLLVIFSIILAFIIFL